MDPCLVVFGLSAFCFEMHEKKYLQKSSKILGGYSLFLLIDMLFKMLILHAGCHSLIVSYMHTLWFKDFIFAGFSFLVENFKLKGF